MSKEHGGFILLEVLVAIVVLSITVGLILQGLSIASSTIYRMGQYLEILTLSQNMLTEDSLGIAREEHYSDLEYKISLEDESIIIQTSKERLYTICFSKGRWL